MAAMKKVYNLIKYGDATAPRPEHVTRLLKALLALDEAQRAERSADIVHDDDRYRLSTDPLPDGPDRKEARAQAVFEKAFQNATSEEYRQAKVAFDARKKRRR